MSEATKPIIGILGGIGSGKSTVAAEFARQGCAVIDADTIAKAAYDDPAVVATLVGWWGDRVLDGKGGIDRRAVGAIVFEDDVQKARLEAVLHPRVHAERRRLRAIHEAEDAVKAIVEDTPLLLEAGLAEGCDALVFVDAPRAVREARVRDRRGWPAGELKRREAGQASLDIKREAAHYHVRNDAGPAGIAPQVRDVLSQVLSSDSPDPPRR
ncbi:MAG: dephospho-CoA kinase [Planctomycetota bacterium]